jgi:hypothetical protein
LSSLFCVCGRWARCRHLLLVLGVAEFDGLHEAPHEGPELFHVALLGGRERRQQRRRQRLPRPSLEGLNGFSQPEQALAFRGEGGK